MRNLIFLFLFICQQLCGNWSMPPEIISPTIDATTPFIVSDNQGNSVAIWYRLIDSIAGTGTLQGATLASGSVNALGQPNWILTDPISLDVLVPGDNSSIPLGIDASGNAIVAWTDTSNNVFTSMLLFGQTSWSAPVLINTQLPSETVGVPYLATAPNGITAVLWASSPAVGQYHVLANVYDAQNNLWKGQQDIFGGTLVDSPMNQVAIDPQGNAVAVLMTTLGGLQSASYNYLLDTWTVIPPIPAASLVDANVAVDNAGNAIFLWFDFDSSQVLAATLPFGQTTIINQTTLSSNVAFGASLPKIEIDQNGIATAVWPDASGAIGSARFVNGNWIINPLLNLGFVPEDISLSVDSQSNAVIGWTGTDGLASYIQAAFLPKNSSIWTLVTTLSPANVNRNVQVSITEAGHALALWEDDINPNNLSGTINASIFLNITISAPLNFSGYKTKNRFLTQTDYIHVLTWQASPSPEVQFYNLYRNFVLIAQIPAIGVSFRYEDHNRRKHESDIYTLTAVSAAGTESQPVSIAI